MRGTTIVLSVPSSNLFFTEYITRHLQRVSDETVAILLITNDETSDDVRDLVWLLAQHPRTSLAQAHGCRDHPIGASIDAALASADLRARLLFTHMDIIFREPKFWECAQLDGGKKIASGRFVQESLWHRAEERPFPRPADDYILVDTQWYVDNALTFRAYARARDAFTAAPWLAAALPDFHRADGTSPGLDYPLDPFNLSHLQLSHVHGQDYHGMWTYRFPDHVHYSSVLRALQQGVAYDRSSSVAVLWVPHAARLENAGYQWRTILRYAILSSLFFNPRADDIIPLAAVRAVDPGGTAREYERLANAIRLLRDVSGILPHRALGEATVPVEIRWYDGRAGRAPASMVRDTPSLAMFQA